MGYLPLLLLLGCLHMQATGFTLHQVRRVDKGNLWVFKVVFFGKVKHALWTFRDLTKDVGDSSALIVKTWANGKNTVRFSWPKAENPENTYLRFEFGDWKDSRFLVELALDGSGQRVADKLKLSPSKVSSHDVTYDTKTGAQITVNVDLTRGNHLLKFMPAGMAMQFCYKPRDKYFNTMQPSYMKVDSTETDSSQELTVSFKDKENGQLNAICELMLGAYPVHKSSSPIVMIQEFVGMTVHQPDRNGIYPNDTFNVFGNWYCPEGRSDCTVFCYAKTNKPIKDIYIETPYTGKANSILYLHAFFASASARLPNTTKYEEITCAAVAMDGEEKVAHLNPEVPFA